MSKSEIHGLEFGAKVRKRAQWEAFEFSLLGDGEVQVRNQSYPDEEIDDHTYTVQIENGKPNSCDCPYAEYHDGDCKHQAAIAIRRPLIDAAVASEKPMISDGGKVLEDGTARDETCPNGSQRCEGPKGDVLPCFPCYMEAER